MSDDGFAPVGDTLRVRVEGDIVFVRNFGYMTPNDLHALNKIYAEAQALHGVFFAMFDVEHSKGLERETRKELTAPPGDTPTPSATTIFGASFAIRTLTNMIERALKGLGKPGFGLRMFETEAEARAYLDQERKRLKSGG